jgi:peptide/nickel transport system ATP-binding protein
VVARLELRDLTVRSTSRQEPVLRGVSLSVEPGQILGLVGESGSGKTITGLAVMGMLPSGFEISGGHVSVLGREIASAGKPSARKAADATMVFQNPLGALNPTMRIGKQLVRVLRRNRGLAKRDAQGVALDLLRRVGISGAERVLASYPHQLSGGMTQRVMIAIALACDSAVIVADEPTTALDVTVQAQIFDLVTRVVAENGCSVVLVTHDLAAVAQLCDRVAVLYAGQLMEIGDTDAVLEQPHHPYTRFLLESVTKAGDPNVVDLGPDWSLTGCRYAHRCPLVHDACASIPESVPVGPGGHVVSCVLAESRVR